MKKIITLLFLLQNIVLISQTSLSNRATASVLTCGAGDNLYTAFGHSAFRVYDPLNGIDKVYNYGTFDTNQPNFYLNFMKGKMTYILSTTSFDYFLREYRYFGRWVKMQQLNLSSEDVQHLYNFLENNALPENRAYQYDFFYENCSTKIESVLKEVLKNNVSFSNNHITTEKTHRDLLTEYTHKKFAWAGFGMDLILGRSNDQKISKDEYKFLPDYLYKGLEHATILRNEKPENLVAKSYRILPERPRKSPFFLTPFLVMLLLSIVIIFITYKNYKNHTKSRWLDVLIWLSTGIVGVIILLLWFGTNHTTTYSNFNILWAFAPNIIIPFILLKNQIWLQRYFILLSIGIVASLLVWATGFQQFHLAILPLLIALGIRYFWSIFSIKNHS
ncbi:MAG: DUF4105 domain-containing protein [Flavobacteriaceae bacterium]|nr:DUF4105 domain-containing protein [Flavobacteriaceae bacterium]